MGNFPTVKPKDLIKFLELRGFVVSRSKGSHILLVRNFPSLLRVTVPVHSRELKRGTLQAIMKQAGLTKEDLQSIRS